MASKLGWIFVIVLISHKISFASSITARFGTFRNLHRHPKLKSCADKVLKENLYVGGRVHTLTGECEGLNRSWAFNQTVQSGYAYTRKVSVQESQIPPLENESIWWTIPGVMREGALVAVEAEIPPGDIYGLVVAFVDTLDEKYKDNGLWEYQMIRMGVDRGPDGKTKFHFTGFGRLYPVSRLIDECTGAEMKHKISFKAQSGSLEVIQLLVDDHELCMVNTTVDLTTFRKINIALFPGTFHGVEFIDA